MKRIAKIVGIGLVVAIAAGYVFRVPLFSLLESVLTSSMYVTADTDDFDPGLPIGAQFPAIRALHDGREIDSIDQFILGKGVVFIATRSVDW